MAIVSSSRHCRYDVFLSFRGEDTRTTFTDHLYTALRRAGFRTFRDDDEIGRGEVILSELQKAIQRSRTCVIVFSKDYTASRWCLDELVMILERKRSSPDHVVLPVFYHVDPSHVRNQKGSIAKAFARHQKTQSSNKVDEWRDALKEVANMGGMVFKGYESQFIDKIVKVIRGKLSRTPLSVAPTMIGMDSRSRIVDSWLRDGSLDIGILVMYGMSGIGKTTIAKHVYNSNFSRFEGSSFLENITEKSQLPNGLVQIQRQLIRDILNGRKVKIQSVSEGITKIEDAISSRKVLIVLDDVDDMDEFDAILRMRDQFYPGSKIIVTTKRARLSKAHQVTKVHEVGILDDNESLKLFSWHAFGQDHPIEGYIEHSEKVVHHCGGLPLALQVLGSSLVGDSIGVWKSALEKLEAIPDGKIMNKLRISYNSLQDEHDRQLFLHIACFFIGNDKDYIVKILDGCDFYTIVGIQNLIDRCLVTIDDDKVRMHDMIREMGREIVRLESKEPSKRSRVWHYKDSFKILIEKTGTQTIEGLVLNMHMNPANSPINSNERVLETSAFARMHKLELLCLSHVHLNGCYAEFPIGLRWLCWIKFPLDSIPIDFPMESLIVLEMQYSSLRQVIFKGTKCINSLKILDLSHSHGITETGDFSSCPSLEKIILVDCASLIEVHESIGYLERLVYLNMKDCKNLKFLPKNMFMLKSLETLIISGCSNLNEFPVGMKNMESLRVLETDEVRISELGQGRSSCILNSLPCSLVALSLRGCNLSDDAFPTDFSSLSSLRRLDLEDNPISGLPNCIQGLTKLDELSVRSCTRLKSLVGQPKLQLLKIEGCTSLEQIIPGSSRTCMSGNYKLIEVGHRPCTYKLKPIGSLDVEMNQMINHLSLGNLESMAPIRMYKGRTISLSQTPIQGMYEEGIFSTFFAGNEVPGQFSRKSRESPISFAVPLLHGHSIRGLIVFAVYADSGNDFRRPDGFYDVPGPLVTRVRNKSKGLKWIYCPWDYGVPGEGEDMIWLSHWKLENHLEGGDEVVVSVIMQPCFQVKEFGVQLVQVQDENNMMITTQHNTTPAPYYPCVTSGDLVHQYKPGVFLLSGWSEPIHDPIWFSKVLGDSDEDTDKEEEQQEEDHTIEAQRGNSSFGPKSWKLLLIAAGFFLTLSVVVRWVLSLSEKEETVDKLSLNFLYPT